MAKANKRRQRERAWQRAKAQRDVGHKVNPDSSPLAELERRCVRLVSCEIVFEPLLDKVQPGKDIVDVLGEDEREELFEQVNSEPAVAEKRLRALIEEHPDCPVLINWLCTSLELLGRRDETLPLAANLFNRFPSYLFGVINYAMLLLHCGDIEQCTKVLDKRFELTALASGRSKFHITELRAFVMLMVCYFVRLGQPHIAERYFGMLERIDPDGAETQQAREMIEMSSMLRRLKSRLGKVIGRKGT